MMPLIEWRDEFSVGVPDVDHEHQGLIELINELHASLSVQSSPDAAMDFLGEIYAKISAHFALEERIMRENRYDQYEDHKADHERLLDELRDIMDALEDRAIIDDNRLSAALGDWFAAHFKTKDARLHRRLG